MDIEKYIASGILELYVAGALSPEENLEVQHYAIEYPKIQQEIEAIEAALLEVTEKMSPGLSESTYNQIIAEIDDVIPFTPEVRKKKTLWTNYAGWAAALLFAIGMVWMYVGNQNLKTELQISSQQAENLKDEIIRVRTQITNTEETLKRLREKSISLVNLDGQDIAPESYAKVFWDQSRQMVVIDALGLPNPPVGYAYQVWSLMLNPLTPTSLGLLSDFEENEKRLFELENPNASEAFGITLEPAGGSKSPTLEQLYTLGQVSP